MPTEIFKVVSYKKNNGNIECVHVVYRGNYNNCLKFYINNKNKYKKQNKYLKLMLLS